MRRMTTLDEVMKIFLAYSPPDMKGKYDLARIKALLQRLGNPQEKIPVIHIAGTSGKTSTAYFIRGLLEAAGQRTGLTVSPHIVGINERVQVDGQPLAEQDFLSYAREFLDLVDASGIQPTYFELLTALAYDVFARERVDYAVIETGLGGLLDGTNVVARTDKVCVITDIGLDHTTILGDTIGQIATQKAGIIQPGNRVIMHEQDPDVMEVIETTVQRQHATLQLVEHLNAPETLPDFQRRNWALAMTVFDYVRTRDNLPQLPANASETVAQQTPPGRWEVYSYGTKTIILDGAHNPQKLRALTDSLRSHGIESVALLANLVEAPEAKVEASLHTLRPFTSHLIIPGFSAGQDLKSRHSIDGERFAHYAAEAGFTSIEQQPNPRDALQALLHRPEKFLLVTGSLYLVSALRPYVRKLANDRVLL